MDIDGVLLLDKPKGCTSHDMVDFLRRRFGLRKVGHCGTLDPLATGLLVLVLGKATRIQDLLMAEDKTYRGTMRLGQITDTQDADGRILEERPVPSYSLDQLEAVFAKFSGEFLQVPPMVSAIKHHGKPLYKLAREGKVIERPPRAVEVYSYRILEWKPPMLGFEISCRKGFYVRTYCHDIGLALGCGAHLAELRRLQSGNFSVERALSFASLQQMHRAEELLPHVLSLPEVSRIRRQ
ncbi:tRNA pseudouridine synthase B [Methylacidimicrobium sp. AP8]|uniref:tRNA pseudouridine(55) synthase TruB n=1 Tax=Methylacidimicrobium sp. AP8 TaxID=2730359 RepID=UPI0018C1BDF3|nr:tRNA pseudouridine(55) synthase TruB [Methylacidimicrobium sp. AP8]CAB4242540.1 tRNA pseudouridine synthase B [Methylacidimicrobium sp. AP8]